MSISHRHKINNADTQPLEFTMPIEKRTAEDAFAGMTKVARYPSPNRDGHRYTPHPDVQHTPAFSISASDKILTIGSCFARNIERALKQLDMNVMTSYVDGLTGQDNIANKYTSKSILNDLQLALLSEGDIGEQKMRQTIYVNDKGAARNLAFGGAGSVSSETLDEVLVKSRRFYENLAKARDADLIILTFGLIETWYDGQNECYLNIPPSRGEIKKYPGRFSLHVLSYEDVRSDMRAIFELLNTHGKSDVRILCSISPVPLSNTFRAQDCLQANTYSKAVQRAAIEEVLPEFDNVHYFPSYEMVTLSSPAEAWTEGDYRHVNPKLVDRIIRKVVSAYIDPDLLPPRKVDLAQLYKNKDFGTIIEQVERYMTRTNRKSEDIAVFMKYYLGGSYLKSGQNKKLALKLIKMVADEAPSHLNAKKLLEIYAPLGAVSP